MKRDLVKEIPITTYYVAIDTKNKKIVDLKFFSYGKYTSFKRLDTKTAIKYADKDYLQKEIEELSKHKEGEAVSLLHRFYEKDKKHFIYVRVKIRILKIEDGIYYCVGVNEDISKEKENESIVNALKHYPQVGMIIYKEKVLYSNDTIINIYKGEVEGRDIREIVEFDDKMSKNFQKRLIGESFHYSLKDYKLINAINERKIIEVFLETIYYEKSFAGLGLVIDKTYEFKVNLFEEFLIAVGNLRLKLFNKNNYSKKGFIEGLYEIFSKEYKCSIKIDKYLLGEKLNLDYKEITIFENGKKLFIPIRDGYLLLESDFNNEFEDLSIYKEIQKTISFTIDSIEKYHFLKLLITILDKSYQWIVITDNKGKILYVNDSVTTLSGYSKDELIDKTPNIFKSGYHSDDFYKSIWENLENNKSLEAFLINKNKNGEIFYLKNRFLPIKFEDEIYYVSVGVDVTNEEHLRKSLKFDKLTNVLNREGFIKKAKEYIFSSNYSFALLIIDIRNFKAINEIKGSKFGDLMLQEFVNFLKDFFYEEDLIARVGSDEFAILLKIEKEKIENVLKEFIEKIKNKNLEVNIGIALYPDDGEDILMLLEKAFIALEYAKKEGINIYTFYNDSLKEKLKYILQAKNLIKEALNKDLFDYYFQPYYSYKENRIVGAEALIRIIKENEVISPYMFIDYAEESGMITEIERKMFKKILNYSSKIDISLSFNFSANSFKNKNFLQNIFKEKVGNLTLELTEREIAENIDYAKEAFSYLKNLGFKVAIDDFGTGYSNFMYIKELDFDVIKIDMSFIKNIINDKKNLAIVKAIITLAKDFNLTTIAEGVETREQLKILEKLGCDIVQGYLISKPLPFDEMKEFLETFSGLD